MKVTIDDIGDHVCEHGTAVDVHCCHCHSGFIFDFDHECMEETLIPRRARLDQFTPAEKAIYDAVQAIEAMAADVRLTDAVVLLQAARDSVADFVDGIEQRRYVRPGPPPHLPAQGDQPPTPL